MRSANAEISLPANPRAFGSLAASGFRLGIGLVVNTVCFMSERISVNPDTCNGRPVVRGTRIAVQTVLEFLAAGDSTDDVLRAYPSLAREDIQACLDFASRLMANHYSVVAVA